MNDRLPLVSVIMPVRNEGAYIERSLGAVLAQDYPADLLEVIVADGMSTDNTRDYVYSVMRTHPNVKLVDNPKRIAPTALNLATAAARGEVVVRVDGHCEIAPDYLSACVRHLREDGVDGVGGGVDTVGETDEARAIAAAMSSVFGVGGTAFRMRGSSTQFVDTIPFPAYPREVIDRVGPYDEAMVRDQDDEYNYRIRKAGGRLLLAQDVHSVYYSRADLSSLGRQFYGYGYWKARVLWRHPRQMKLRQFVPGAFVGWLCLALALAPFSRWARRSLTAAVLAYDGAAVAASLRVASQSDWGHLPRLPVAFAAMHLGYGAGFLVGNAAVGGARLRRSNVGPVAGGEHKA